MFLKRGFLYVETYSTFDIDDRYTNITKGVCPYIAYCVTYWQ